MIYSNVLVTGCGGDIGLGIGRILKIENAASQIIGCDIHYDHPGVKVFDKFEIMPRADSDDYQERLKNLINKYAVDIIIPASEPELRFYYKNDLTEQVENIPVIIANKKALEIGFDKLKTADLLKSVGLPYPWTTVVSNGEPREIPCILKSRSGSGSRDVTVISDNELIGYYSRKRPDDIWQEYLKPDIEEYTCGLYRSLQGEIRTIIFKRKLGGGHTVFGEVVCNNEIDKVLIKLAEALDLRGSINAQLRLTEKGPVIFEINPRFSSTVVFRHILGFTDLIWSLQEKKGQVPGSYVPPKEGIRFCRAAQEIIL